MQEKILKPNYERSILSISSSILKKYNLKSNYKSLKELDEILKKEYKNIVFLILDGLGSNILENNLTENSFLKKHILTNVTSVFPPTTAAATIAMHSGASPYENGWVGWMPYIKEYDSMLELFSGKDFYTREKIVELPEKGILKYKTIYDQIIEENKNVKFHKVFPNFDSNGSDTFEELCENIEKSCSNENLNLISAYWTEPDHTIHSYGVYSKETKDVLNNIDINLEKLSKKLKNTLIIITADHGAIDLKEVYINEIEEINECLSKPPSIESRFVSFFIKENKKKDFKRP